VKYSKYAILKIVTKKYKSFFWGGIYYFPRYSHLHYVCICNRTKVMAKKTFWGGPHGSNLEIQYGVHVTSSPMAPFNWPDPKTWGTATCIMFNRTKVMAKTCFGVDLMGAILKSNMAAMWRHRQWHHLIGRTQKPRYSHLNYVGIATWIMFVSVMEPKLWQKNFRGGPHVGHLGIQYGDHVTSSPMVPFDWPDPNTYVLPLEISLYL
jgi:hypothetical protein